MAHPSQSGLAIFPPKYAQLLQRSAEWLEYRERIKKQPNRLKQNGLVFPITTISCDRDDGDTFTLILSSVILLY